MLRDCMVIWINYPGAPSRNLPQDTRDTCYHLKLWKRVDRMSCSFSTLGWWQFLQSVLVGNILGNPNLSLLLNCERGVLNVLEVHGITALMNIHRWTNKKITLYFLTLENDNWFNFYFVLVSLNKKIASVEQGMVVPWEKIGRGLARGLAPTRARQVRWRIYILNKWANKHPFWPGASFNFMGPNGGV